MMTSLTTNRLLVADDDRFIRELISRNLPAENLEIECVPSGEAALERIGQDHFDAVILDVHMEGMTGPETIDRIREVDSLVPIMIVTGDHSIETERKARHRDVFYYFVKPLDLAEIRDVVDSAIHSRRAQASDPPGSNRSRNQR